MQGDFEIFATLFPFAEEITDCFGKRRRGGEEQNNRKFEDCTEDETNEAILFHFFALLLWSWLLISVLWQRGFRKEIEMGPAEDEETWEALK